MDICVMKQYKVIHKWEASNASPESTREEVTFEKTKGKEAIGFMDGSNVIHLIKNQLEDAFSVTLKDNEIVFEYFNPNTGENSIDVYKIEAKEDK